MKYSIVNSLCLLALILIGCVEKPSSEIFDLKCDNLNTPLAIDNIQPHFSWKIQPFKKGLEQVSYRIMVSSDSAMLLKDNADMLDTERIESCKSVMIPYNGKTLSSPMVYFWKVMVWYGDGNVSGWSPVQKFGTGIQESEAWNAEYIGMNKDNGNVESPLLRKTFNIDNKKDNYLLHVNSLGYHEVYINGKKVGKDVLSPAVSQLDKRSLSVTYDVASYLNKGKNEIILWLGQGWYRKPLYRNAYDGPLVKARLEQCIKGAGNTIFVTDNTWEVAVSGYTGIGTWLPGQFGGEKADLKLIPGSLKAKDLEDRDWYPVYVADVKNVKVSPQMCEPNRIMNAIKPANIKKTGDNAWLVDMGTTLTGWIEFKLPEQAAGEEVILEYSDHFDGDGNLADMGQKDICITSGGKEDIFRNKFNYHAFRYIKISNLKNTPEKDNITAFLIHPDFEQTSSFECSDEDMNAIHDMIMYTFKCITVGGYMVDCPHIERLGYGGDGNASTQTLQTMFSVSPIYSNWMMAWEDCIRPDGGLPHTAPCPYMAGGGPYWCAFVISASWRTYVNYNDPRLIKKYYPLMEQWLEYVYAHSVDGLLKRWPNTNYRNWYLGDWATPSGVDQTNEKSVDLVNNCCISQCFGTMAKIANVLGKHDDMVKYSSKQTDMQKLIHETFFDKETNIYGTGSQIDLAYPMIAGVTERSLRNEVIAQFEKAVQEKNGHLATGLVGVPILAEWAVRCDAVELMYSMLKKREYPGYLYMIDNDATSTWEHWNGERSRIHNCYNGIGSWFYQAIGGICPNENGPGYNIVDIKPQIPSGITWAKVSQETAFGTIRVNWKIEDGNMFMNVTLPVGCTGMISLPGSPEKYILDGVERSGSLIKLPSGEYTFAYGY